MKKKIVLIRHGKTKGNEEKRYIGKNTDEELSDKGRSEISDKEKALRDLVSGEAVIYSSPLKRAFQTASQIFYDKDICVIDELTEMDFGRFEGKNYEELKDDPAYMKWVNEGGREDFPDGETMDELTKRSMIGLHKALSGAGYESVIFCHGGNIMAIMSKLTGKQFFDFHVDNICGYILEAQTDDERILDLSYCSIDDRIYT